MNRSLVCVLMVVLGIATALTLTGASVAMTGSSHETVRHGQETVLRAGDSLQVNAGVSFAPRNDGHAAARVLVASIFPAAALTPPTNYPADRPAAAASSAAMFVEPVQAAAWPAGVTVEPLAVEQLTAGVLGPGKQRLLRVARFALPPTETTVAHDTAGPTLLAVETGLGILAPASSGDEPALLAAGDGAGYPRGTTITVQGVGDATLGLVVLTLSADSR